MPAMPDLSNIIGSIDFSASINSMMYWFGYGILALGAGAIIYFLYMYLDFNIKADVRELYGSGTDGVFSFGKRKKNRVKWIKNKAAWRSMYPLFNKKDIEPFDQEFVYPGKQIYVFDLNGAWIPGRININKTEGKLRAEINPVPYYVRNWQSLEHKKNAQEFSEHDFWAENKYFIMLLLTAGACLLMVGLTVYFTYKYAAPGVAATEKLSSVIENLGKVSGVGG